MFLYIVAHFTVGNVPSHHILHKFNVFTQCAQSSHVAAISQWVLHV